MKLRTLGGLELEGAGFTQPKPLLLLAYLAVEGAQARQHLAELFWPEGGRMKSLSMTLTRLRQGANEVVGADAGRAWAQVESDAQELLGALDKSDWARAVALYGGAFLEGVYLEDWSTELEEWVYETREYLAERVQYALLNLAEACARREDFEAGALYAQRAYRLPGGGALEPALLKRLYTVLVAGGFYTQGIGRELESFGLSLQLSSEEARAALTYASSSPIPSNLPVRRTSFVGRDPELAELGNLLSDPASHLLTLLGPAGVGKTRLALQLAQEQLRFGRFADGVYFVPLDALLEPGLIPSSLASILQLSPQGQEDPRTQIIRAIGRGSMLLVLDNFEQLSGGATLLSELMQGCPNLKLLVTSRERLHLEEEQVFALEGLPYPKDDALPLQEAMHIDAVGLFVHRAQRVNPPFELNAGNLADVTRLCRLVEGLPLGLELAASWTRIMPCSDIAAEIERNLDFLSVETRDIPARHRSLRAAFESSWGRLTSKEQTALAKLSVFRGGFRREAAAEVAGATIPVLASLVDKSLLRVLPNGRYDRHPLLYQYTQEKLAEQPELRVGAEERHRHYYLRLLQQQDMLCEQGRQKEVIATLAAEWENIRLTLERSLAETDLAALKRFIGLMHVGFEPRGAHREALDFLERAEAGITGDRPEHREVLAQVLIEKAWYWHRLGDLEEARAAARRGLLQLSGDEAPSLSAKAWITLGVTEQARGQLADASTCLGEALALARASGDSHVTASALGSLGILEGHRGNYAAAEAYFQEALALHQKAGRILSSIREMDNLAITYGLQGELANAERIQLEGLQLAKDINFRQTMPYALSNLGVTYALQGAYDKARAFNYQALQIAEETDQRNIKIGILNNLAGLMVKAADYRQALDYSTQALQLATSLGATTMLLQALLFRGELELARGQVEQAAKLLRYVLIHPATVSDERAHAQALMDEVAAKLSPAQLEGAEHFAASASLESVTQLALREEWAA